MVPFRPDSNIKMGYFDRLIHKLDFKYFRTDHGTCPCGLIFSHNLDFRILEFIKLKYF